jgi:hypothetical protein
MEAPKSHECKNNWPGNVIAVGQNMNLHVHCRVMLRIQKMENYIFRQVVQWKLNFSNEMIHRLSNITICNIGSGDQIPTEATSPWREVLNYKKQTSCWLEETNKRTQTMNSSREITISKAWTSKDEFETIVLRCTWKMDLHLIMASYGFFLVSNWF